MNIMDLEEAEGLTAEMVRGWLERMGWKRATIQNPKLGEMWQLDGGPGGTVWIMPELGRVIKSLVALCDVSPQRLLREMNPRMRKGRPTDMEVEAHVQRGGIWIATRGELGRGGTICFINFYWDTGLEDPGPFSIWDGQEWSDTDWEDGYDLSEWSFWPSDAHGNKVAWPKVNS